MGVPAPVAILIIIALGGLLGLYNGVLCAYLRIPAFITTLASLGIFRGMAFMINKGSPIFSVSKMVQSLFYGKFLGLPLVFYYIILFYGVTAIFMKYTEAGREIYAVSGNAAAARFSGINVKRVTMLAFVIAGMMAGVASVLMTARLNSGSPNYGVGMELSAIAAAVIGGASLSGGHGNILSTLFGALTIVIVQNALNLHAVPTSVQNIIIGFIIMLAVFIDMWRAEIGALFSRLMPANR
ncbi:MAG: ABC transporter permease [bacterium]|nr:ABC transporter permease [bacterium]